MLQILAVKMDVTYKSFIKSHSHSPALHLNNPFFSWNNMFLNAFDMFNCVVHVKIFPV